MLKTRALIVTLAVALAHSMGAVPQETTVA